MLHALKWTESFFTGLAIVLIALAVVAVPSNYVWGDDPIDPGGEQVGMTKCSAPGCQTATDGCTETCNQKVCNEGGQDPAFAKCNAIAAGCRCKAF